MKFHADCVTCLLSGAQKKVQGLKDQALKLEYMRGICRIMDNVNPDYDSAPLVDARIIQLKRDLLGMEDDYTDVKHSFNSLILGLYDPLKERVRNSEDPLLAAIQLSMAGNFIDFGVLKDVDPDEVLRLLDDAASRRVDAAEYEQLRRDLAAPGELVFLHDNCGEVVLDKLLIETIREAYPEKKILSVVRGGPILNDATMEDAIEIGLTDVVEVVGNGQKDIAGTQLDLITPQLRSRMESAALVIAKGQGNFETLIGCGDFGPELPDILEKRLQKHRLQSRYHSRNKTYTSFLCTIKYSRIFLFTS